MAKTPPLLAVRPRFDSALTTIEAVPIAIACTVAATLLGATFLFMFFNILGMGRLVSAGPLYTIVFILTLALSPALYFEVKKSAYRQTFYNFYPDWLEYQDFRWFLTRRRSRIRLIDINDVFENASILQSRRVLTSLYLAVPGVNQSPRGGFSGLKILDIPENSGLREKVIALIEDSTKRYYAAAQAPAGVPVTPPVAESMPSPLAETPAPAPAQMAPPPLAEPIPAPQEKTVNNN